MDSIAHAAAHRRQVRQLTGWMVLLYLLVFFGIIFAVNAYMAYAATSTFGGLETASSYQAGLSFAREIERADAQEARHWQVDATLRPAGDGNMRVDLTARDASGLPLDGLDCSLTFVHPTDRTFDHQVAMRAHGDGRFRGGVAAAPGQWDLIIELSRNGERLFRSRNRVGIR
ncbi:MAG TPA: FixH family protein [Pseudolabrys sp.]|nr:FixH family protein [Pseudolabrys sp.]